MSHTISATGKPFGLQRVCQVLDLPRSTIYDERARALNKVTPLAFVRRGPKLKVPDHELLAAVRADLTRTPFVGEGGRARSGHACAFRTTSACPAPMSRC
ncbi:MAG: hypothetical protein VB137_03930 [Burkholderia sp.]